MMKQKTHNDDSYQRSSNERGNPIARMKPNEEEEEESSSSHTPPPSDPAASQARSNDNNKKGTTSKRGVKRARAATATKTKATAQAAAVAAIQQHPLVQSLRRIDPLLQFLTKATGQVLIPWTLIQKSLPAAVVVSLSDLQALHQYGVLRIVHDNNDDDDDKNGGSTRDETAPAGNEREWRVGFPPPPLTTEATTTTTNDNDQRNFKTIGGAAALPMMLHGSTKKGAQQRLQWLQKQLLSTKVDREEEEAESSTSRLDALAKATSQKRRAVDSPFSTHDADNVMKPTAVTPDGDRLLRDQQQQQQQLYSCVPSTPPCSPRRFENENTDVQEQRQVCKEHTVAEDEKGSTDHDGKEEEALSALRGLMKWPNKVTFLAVDAEIVSSARKAGAVPTCILPKQASFAGSQAAQPPVYGNLPSDISIPPDVFRALSHDRPLYQHQVQAIRAALRNKHVSLTTGTGSGKSLAFLMPVITRLVQADRTALLLFPTKALAQDQLGKLQVLAASLDDTRALRPATLDGDTPHSQRRAIAQGANLILTNPDTLNAAVLPNWEKDYCSLLAKMCFIVVDEAHSYQGIFGAHVALILSRLRRVCAVARAREQLDEEEKTGPSLHFIAASATLPWPEVHVRKLCPIGPNETVEVIADDTSPRAAKHFFVWNPPLLSAQGVSSGSVTMPRKKSVLNVDKFGVTKKATSPSSAQGLVNQNTACVSGSTLELKSKIDAPQPTKIRQKEPDFIRRHAADETALLLARAVTQGVRCMAFAKTRNLVEWIFERTLAALKADPRTAHLSKQVESYRGGYTRAERRKIEERLFRNELMGVVGTNALELGVDVGGIDLTLHCGYPSSYASLLQQAGRGGRGSSQNASCAIVICFNSPSEQHLWRFPRTLLSKGLTPSDTIPLSNSTVQSHLLCASSEFPLTGTFPAEYIVTETTSTSGVLSDCDLFGGKKLYEGALKELKAAGSCTQEEICVASDASIIIYKAHPAMKKAWSLVAIRSIEPVNYSIVDLSHPLQGGRTDGIYDEHAVLDTLPYSRVFYHAHPGSIITHRGTRYKVISMTRPPEPGVLASPGFRFRRNIQLSAFAKPTSARYSTRPLSRMHITIIKQFESVELQSSSNRVRQVEDIADLRSPVEEDSSVGSRKIGVEDDSTPSEDGLHDTIPQNLVEPNRKKQSCTELGVLDISDSCEDEIYVTSFSGCGTVNVKRTVHGYKKLSLITRTEISRSELSLPDMEFDTFGLWFDIEAHAMSASLGSSRYGEGVHALSHALLAVAPLFEAGLVRDDLECDHSYFSPTRLCLFDERAGGSGSCERLWKHFFVPKDNIMDAALDLLRNCDSCNGDDGYEGGCPACLHAPQCLKFNMNLSRSAAVVVGERMLERIKMTDLYEENEKAWTATKQLPLSPSRNLTPRRRARREALKKAKQMRKAQDTQFVVGRASWPQGASCGHQEQA